MPTLRPDTIVVASPDQVSSDLAGETVLLSMTTAHYYGLAGVGARIWSLVSEPVTVASICDTIAQEYDAPAQQIETDVVKFLEALADHRLIEVRSGGSP